MSIAKLEEVKKVKTYTPEGKENGSLMELYKNGLKTVAYLTTIIPGGFKGYHLHRVRAARYMCIRGKAKIIVYKNKIREEYVLDANNPKRMFIPNNIATGLQNIATEDVWLINYPDPPYDPNLKDEQVEYTQEELEKGIVK